MDNLEYVGTIFDDEADTPDWLKDDGSLDLELTLEIMIASKEE